METANKNVSPTADREIKIEREIGAPIELVWKVWTDPEHIRNWWGPNGFTNTISKMDMQPGGKWNLVMHGPDGTDYRNESEFREIILHKKIVYEHLSGPKFTATITFEARGAKTFLSWHMLFRSREEFIHTVKTFKADKGLEQNFEKLERYVQDQKSVEERSITITRVINAPRELVFDAWTKPEHLAKWWGPNGFTITTHDATIRKDDRWKFTMHGPDRTDYPNLITYKEIISPERLHYTNTGKEDPENPDFESTVTFEEVAPRKTKVTMTVVLPSREALEYVVREHGAKEGGEQTIAKMAAYVESLQ